MSILIGMVKNKVDCLFFLIIFPCNSSETLVMHSFRFFIPIKSYWVLDPEAVDICIQRHNFLGFVAFGFWGLFLNRFVFVSRLYYFFRVFSWLRWMMKLLLKYKMKQSSLVDPLWSLADPLRSLNEGQMIITFLHI